MESENLVQIMTEKAAAVGAVVHEISSISSAVKYTVDLNIKKNLKTISCPGLGAEYQEMLQALCNGADMILLNPPLRETGSNLDTCLTFAEYGIADTGTLMVISDSEDIRIATMLSQIHIAMLPISKIRPDSAGIEPELDALLKSDSPSYTAFITGASRTADIERVLAIGVHGPVELHLLLIKED